MYDIQPYNLENVNFTFDFSKASYKIDSLQSQIIDTYTRIDKAFRNAIYNNLTNYFIKMIKDKVALGEPIHISVMGTTRGGKTETMFFICVLHQALNGRKWTINYACPNRLALLERIRTIKNANPEALRHSIFQLDEEKNVFGVGSTAKKTKFSDLQNITAKFDISTISICPTKFSNEEATYGLRILGKCEVTKTCRFMLYNLIEGGTRGEIAIGMVYLPILSASVPEDYAKEILEPYKLLKDKWIDNELEGEGDILYKIKYEKALVFADDPEFLDLGKKDRLVYVSFNLGSEWTRGEAEEISIMANMIINGVIKRNPNA